MTRTFQHIFIKHPKSVNETYLQHMRFAAGFAAQLLGAALAALVHAIIPCLFQKTASRMIQNMNAKITNRR